MPAVQGGAIGSKNLAGKYKNLIGIIDQLHIKRPQSNEIGLFANCFQLFFGGFSSFLGGRSGSQLSFFGANASIWPDLYSACVANLGDQEPFPSHIQENH